jgi:hypothetical protein
MDPKKTIRLLDVLQGLGFSDEAFRLIHHFRLVGRNATINRHRRYCEGLEPVISVWISVRNLWFISLLERLSTLSAIDIDDLTRHIVLQRIPRHRIVANLTFE